MTRFNEIVDAIQYGYTRTDQLEVEFPVSGDALTINRQKEVPCVNFLRPRS
ncbi:hypothetical protein DFO66_103320 [Brevibacterium sanguinis]|uniref:Uncharacterized protein n=2 Tax=Brevibacterium TaxID=1696 RepID=A0A366IKR2_9MICO|nr:hypothetical protein DFO66_103320 [Brevibacterium sanguinis]RBP73024.1 hypothetical protein DFO65_103319 [Brevibacterium celere]